MICEECPTRFPELVAEQKKLESTPAARIDDETLSRYHYVLDAVAWVEDCKSQEPRADGSCPLGTDCFGGWGPCTCGCQAGSWDSDCFCVLHETLADAA